MNQGLPASMPPESTPVSQSENAQAPFVTFYSFKGGVGRSMALINVAGIIAARGFRVLVIDMDLEAPGLSFLAKPGEHDVSGAQQQPGFVDFMLDAVESKADADLFRLSPIEVVERYSAQYELPEGFSHNPHGWLRIMPAGRLEAAYSRTLERLDLPGLYRAGTGLPLLEAFKQTILDSNLFDYVFIDSRTGFSDESGICTRDLADCLIVVSGLNKQNVQGTTRFLATLRNSIKQPRLLEVVLSPIPNGEDALVDTREACARAAFSAAWGAELRTDLHIPYHPQLALTEEPHIFRHRRGYLFDAYHKLERRLRELLGHTADVWLGQSLTAYHAKDYDSTLSLLRRTEMVADTRDWADQFALTVGLDAPDAGAVYEFVIAKVSPHVRTLMGQQIGHTASGIMDEDDHVERADMLFSRALDADPDGQSVLHNYALFLWRRGDLTAAAGLFERALVAKNPLANTVGLYANFLWLVSRDGDAAEAMYIRSLAIDSEHAVNLANYGAFHICAGRVGEGLALVDRALDALPVRLRLSQIAIECYMYVYCCGGAERHEEALNWLKTLAARSITAEDWDFSGVIQQARMMEHPQQQWLPVLADVLVGRQPATSLDQWEAWRQALLIPRPSRRRRG